jgi:hypothetical protein
MSKNLPVKSTVLYGDEERSRHEGLRSVRTVKDLVGTQTYHLGTIHFEIVGRTLGAARRTSDKPSSDMSFDDAPH